MKTFTKKLPDAIEWADEITANKFRMYFFLGIHTALVGLGLYASYAGIRVADYFEVNRAIGFLSGAVPIIADGIIMPARYLFRLRKIVCEYKLRQH